MGVTLPAMGTGQIHHVDATIANGASLSGACNLGQSVLTGIVMPATWTTASLTFQACLSPGGTYQNVYDAAGNELTLPTAGGDRIVAFEPWQTVGCEFLKVRSGTAGSPVNQGGARTVTLILRDI